VKVDIQRRRDEGKRREEQEAGDPPVRRKGQPTRYLDEVDIQRRRDEVKRREEKNKKRVIHLYAGKDNKLAILPRSTIRREEKRREDGMRE
jgi:hypothetical protein